MHRFVLHILAATLCGAVPLAAQSAPRAKVLVLGSYHMANPGLDYANIKADDVLSARRQQEIEALVEALAAFRPTRIALEVPPALDSVLNARYAGYLAGRDTLRRNESDQIGFRLAKRLGHPRVYAVDYRLDLDIGAVFGWAAQNGQDALVGRAVGAVERAVADDQRRLETSTIAEYHRHLNRPAADSLHGLYLVTAAIGRDTLYVGAEMVADWYERNLKIFANLVRLVESPEERILVIFGNGHAPLLRQFVREHPDLELVDLDTLLGPPTGSGG